LPRAEAVYRWIFTLPPCPAYVLRVAGVPDQGALPEDVLAARTEREQASLRSFLAGTCQKYTSMAAVQAWLFSAHDAYAPRSKPRPPVDAATLKTY